MTYSGITSNSSGIKPDPTPEYSPKIRKLHDSLESSIDLRNQSVNANDKTRQINASNSGQGLEALSKLSTTLGNVLGAVQKQRIKRFENEATIMHELGIDTQEKLDEQRAKQDELEKELADQLKATEGAVAKARDNNERMPIVQGIKKLNGYHIAALRRSGLQDEVTSFASNLSENTAAYFAENDLTHEQKIAYIKSFGGEFLSNLSGSYSTSLIAKYAIPAYTKAKNQEIKLLEDANDRDESARIIRDATLDIFNNGSVVDFVQAASSTKDKQGNYLGRSGALDLLQEINRNSVPGSMLDLETLGEETINGQPFEKHPRFAQMKRDRDLATNSDFNRTEAAQRRFIELKKEQFAQLASDTRFRPEDIPKMMEDASKDAEELGLSISPFEFGFYKDHQTKLETRDDDADRDTLENIRRYGRGFVIKSDLKNVSTDVYNDYIQEANDNVKNGLVRPSEVDEKATDWIDSQTNTISLESFGVNDAKSQQWQIIKLNAEAEYNNLYKEFILSGASSPMEAHRLTIEAQQKYSKQLDELVKDADGNSTGMTYRQRYRHLGFGSEIKLDEKRKQEIKAVQGYFDAADNGTFDFNKTVIPGTESYLKQLESYNNGTGKIPKYYEDVTRNHKYITAWDLANSQYFAHTGKKLGKDSRRAAFENSDPVLQQVLTAPHLTKSRLFRTQTDVDYNQLALSNATTSSPTQPLRDLVMSGEGNFDSGNKGFAGDSPGGVPGLQLKTVGEWRGLYNQGWNALGAIQLIPSTFDGSIQRLGLSDDVVMTPDVQFQILDEILLGGVKRPRLSAYLNYESNDLKAAAEDFSLEFASAPNPYTGITSYPNVGNNAASMSLDTVYTILKQVREAVKARRTNQ